MSGVYSWRQQPGSRVASGDAALSIPFDPPTIGTIMQKVGYRTGVIGTLILSPLRLPIGETKAPADRDDDRL